MKNFSLKFIDIMVGIILGLGFQWWPQLHEPWQYIAFVFVYFDIVDYWIDYSPSLKKFPPKREVDILLDLSIMFVLFFYIYVTQLTIVHFLTAFIGLKVLDYFWLLSSQREYKPTGTDRLFVTTWLTFNLIEAAGAILGIIAAAEFGVSPIVILLYFIVFRIGMRVLASLRYKRIHFV